MIKIAGNFASDNPLANQSQMSRRNSNMQQLIQQRIQDQKNEILIRERENERIREMRENTDAAIHGVINCEETSEDLKDGKIQGLKKILAHRIMQIEEARINRAIAAAEREAMRTQAIIEESTTVQEEASREREYETEEEAQKAEERSMTRGMISLAIAADSISDLKQVRSRMRMEAGMLRRAIEGPSSNTVKVGIGARSSVPIISIQNGYDDSFRTRHREKLIRGIARLNGAINVTIAGMYRDSMQIQERQLREYRQEEEEQSYEKHEEGYIL
jgi:hypothetical protein